MSIMADETINVTSSSSYHTTLLALLLSLCSGVAFTAGGLLLCCSTKFAASSRRTSSLSSFALVLAFSTSAFVFISGGVADLLPLVQSRFEQLVLEEHDESDEISPVTARGMSHLLATTSFAVGSLLLFGVNMVVHKLTAAASACYAEQPAQQESGEISSDSLHCIGLSGINARASGATTDAENDNFGLNSSAAVDFDVLQSTDRPWDVKLSKDSKDDASPDSPTSSESTAHVRASLISMLAIVLHHMPGT